MDELKLPRAQHPRLHHAGVRDLDAHQEPGLAADARDRRHRRGDRHPALVPADAEGHRPSLRQGQEGLRRDLRERAGGRAHEPSLPPRQPPRRHGGRHRRPVRARARLGDLRRRRPHVALQRERERAEDADPVPGRLGGGVRRVQRRREARAAPGARDRDLARARARAADRPRRASGPTSCRTSTSTTSCASATRRRRSRSSPARLARQVPAARDPQVAGAVPEALLPATSSSAARIPNAPKVGSGGSLSPRGDWRAPSDGSASAWLENLAQVPRK